jgi:hypothetical protein
MTQETVRVLSASELTLVIAWGQEEQRARAEMRTERYSCPSPLRFQAAPLQWREICSCSMKIKLNRSQIVTGSL